MALPPRPAPCQSGPGWSLLGERVLGACPSVLPPHSPVSVPWGHTARFLKFPWTAYAACQQFGFAAAAEMTCPGLFQDPQAIFTLHKLKQKAKQKQQVICPVPNIWANRNNSEFSKAGPFCGACNRGALFRPYVPLWECKWRGSNHIHTRSPGTSRTQCS